MSLKKILTKIEEEMREREDVKERLFVSMQKATRLSKQAIFLVHKGYFEDAEQLLIETKKLFTILHETPPMFKKLVYGGIVDAAHEEYAEAQIFLHLAQTDKFVSPQEIHVPSTSYLLGLADVVGELRRRTLDSLRRGELKVAEKSLEAMELVYDELLVVNGALNRVPQMRRKSDVARRIIEATRGNITIETGRKSLENAIKKLEKTIKEKK